MQMIHDGGNQRQIGTAAAMQGYAQTQAANTG